MLLFLMGACRWISRGVILRRYLAKFSKYVVGLENKDIFAIIVSKTRISFKNKDEKEVNNQFETS